MISPLNETLSDWMRLVMKHSIRTFMLFAKRHNYQVAQLNALIRLYYKNDCGISDLGEETGVTSAAVSQLMEKMVQHGLVLRTEDPLDRRHKVLMLTETGQKIARESLTARKIWLAHLIELLTPKEQERVNDAIQLLIEKTTLLEDS